MLKLLHYQENGVLNKFLNAIFFLTIVKHQTFVPKFTWIDFIKKAVSCLSLNFISYLCHKSSSDKLVFQCEAFYLKLHKVSNNNNCWLRNRCNFTFKLLTNIFFHVQFVPFVDREINILLAFNKYIVKVTSF